MAYTAGTVHVKWLLPDGTPPPNADPNARDTARRRGSTVTATLSAAADDPQAVLKDPTDNTTVFSGARTKTLVAAETTFTLAPSHGMDPDPSTYDFTVHIEGQPPRVIRGVTVVAGQTIELRDFVATTPPAQVSNLQAQIAGLMTTVDADATSTYRKQSDARLSPFERTVRPQSAIVFGDSITAQGSGVSGSAIFYTQRGWWCWTNAYLGWRFDILRNAGISGNTLTDMIARVQTDVIAYAPAWCFMNGGINDCSNIANYTAAQIIGRFQILFGLLLAAGIKVVCLTINPNANLTTAQNLVRNQVNQWLRAYGAANAGVIIVDTAPYIQDPTSNNPLAGYTADGLHPTPLGAMAMGYAAFQTLDKITVPRSLLTAGADAANILGATGMLNGTNGNGGSVAGLATLWNRSESGAASTYTKVARADGILGERQHIVTPNGNNSTGIYPTTDPTTGFAVGDTIYAAAEVSVANPDVGAVSNQLKTRLQLTCFDAGGAVLASSFFGYDDQGNYSQTFPLPYNATLRTLDLVVPPTTTKIRTILWNDGGATRDWSRAVVRKAA